MAQSKPAPLKKTRRRTRDKPPPASATTSDDLKRLMGSEEFLQEKQRIAERVEWRSLLRDVGDFGLWQLTIREAAGLVARDQWFNGPVEGSGVPDDCEDEYDPRVEVALSGVIAEWEQKLLAAVESGELKHSESRRDIKNGKLVPGKTFVRHEDFREWLHERGHDTGDVVARWEENQDEIARILADEAASLREVSKTGRRAIQSVAGRSAVSAPEVDKADATALRTTLRTALEENHRLKTQLAELTKSESGEPAKVDRVLELRQRRTFLVIIAALCGRAKIDYREKGAPQRVKEATEEIETPIGSETIRRLLKEIPDALLSRRKPT